MHSLFTKAVIGATLGATALTVAAPADAQRYRRWHRGHDRTGVALAAGAIGLGLGAAIASSNRDRYYDRGYYRGGYYGGYYGRPYYGRPYYGGYYDRPYYRGYARDCWTRRVYDPYIGRRVRVRECY